MNSYTVNRTTACVSCDGKGIVYDPLWSEFWRDFKRDQKNIKFLDEIADQWFLARTGKESPPEECECSECDGLGEVTKEIDLEAALKNSDFAALVGGAA